MPDTQPFLIRVCDALSASQVRFAIVGGHAVALHGAVRGTVDIDIAVNWSLQVLLRVEKALCQLGLVSRLPVTASDIFKYRDEYVRNRNLIAWNFHNPDDPSELANLIITYDLTGRKLTRIDVDHHKVIILNRADLIDMKRASGRPQDLEDVKALETLS